MQHYSFDITQKDSMYDAKPFEYLFIVCANAHILGLKGRYENYEKIQGKLSVLMKTSYPTEFVITDFINYNDGGILFSVKDLKENLDKAIKVTVE